MATNHVGFSVRSLERSKAFYIGLLGFEELHSWQADASYIGDIVGHPGVILLVSTLRLPGSDVRLELLEYVGVTRETVNTNNANPGTSHLAFIVDDLRSTFEEWTASGVRSVGQPVVHTTGPNAGGAVVYMIDPDGFRIELIQRAH
jgi:lactoylglutathione lyase